MRKLVLLTAFATSCISKCRDTVQRFQISCSGSAAVLFGLGVIPLLIGAGAAIDYSNASSVRAAMQNALDGAALAAVRSASTESAAQVTSTVQTFFWPSFNRSQASNIRVSASYDPSSLSLTVTGSATVPTTLMSLIGIREMKVSATSTATMSGKRWPICVLITQPSSNHTLIVGNSAQINFTNCMVQVNTQNWDAVEARNGAFIHSTNGDNCFTGDIHYGDVQPPKDPSCTMFPDPFVGYQMPASAATCSKTNYTISGTIILQPGTYCGNTTISGTVTLSPGIYVIKDGNLTITGNSNVTAKGVTFLLTGTRPNFYINGNSVVTITPTQTGQFAGFAFYLDSHSDMSACANAKDGSQFLNDRQTSDCLNSIDGSAQVNISGIVYLANTALQANNYAKLTVNPGSLVSSFLTAANNATISLTGTLNTSTSAEIAMQKNSSTTGYMRLAK